jgi:hypothetical protein
VNKRLNIQVVELEKRVIDLSDAIDPDGSISIESLLDRSLSVDDAYNISDTNMENTAKSSSNTNNILLSNVISKYIYLCI